MGERIWHRIVALQSLGFCERAVRRGSSTPSHVRLEARFAAVYLRARAVSRHIQSTETPSLMLLTSSCAIEVRIRHALRPLLEAIWLAANAKACAGIPISLAKRTTKAICSAVGMSALGSPESILAATVALTASCGP